MGASACHCELPSGARQAAEEIAHQEVDSQAKPTLLQARARSSSGTSPKQACLEDPSRPITVAEPLAGEASTPSRNRAFTEYRREASSQSRDRAFTEPVHHPELKGRTDSTTSGLSTSLLWTAQLTLSFINKLRKAKTPPRASPAAHPDFSGDWLLHRLEGDVEAMLKEVGASWVQRKAAAAMGFGVGKQFVHVDQYPGEINICTSYRSGKEEMAWPKPTCNVYNTDGIEQDITDPEGRTIRTCVTWDGEALSMVSERVGNGCGRPLPSTRRYLQGDGEELVFEQTSPATGSAVKRIYRRYESEASGGRSVKSSVARCK